MRMLTKLSYTVVLLVLALIGSIVAPGVGFVLPRVATSPPAWLLHIAISYALTVGVLFNYLAATFTTPGTVTECCADLPPAFRPQAACGAADASSSISGGGASGGGESGRSSPDGGREGHRGQVGSDGERSGGGGGAAGERSGGGDARTGLVPGDGAVGAAAVGPGLGAAAVGQGGNGGGGGGGGGGPDGRADGRPPAAVEAAALDGAVVVSDGGTGGGAICSDDNAAAAAAAAPLQQSGSAHPAQLVPQFSYSHLRYCWPCRGPQTRGSHHCYACGRCVVDQDHHCPFIANCVGRANLRNFISFLAFTVIAMSYSTAMSAWLLIRDRDDAAEALDTAAATARRARTAAAAAAAGGGRLSRWLVPMTSRADALAAAYILLMSVAVFVAVGTLLAQTVRHAVHVVDGVDPAAAQRVARHHLHPASDAAALIEEADEAPGRGGWRDTVRILRTVMCGSGCGGGAWLWVWPLWGPPPGVLLAPAPAGAGAPQQRQQPYKSTAWSGGGVSGAQGRSKAKTQ
ncbi:hypothetical protein PLESTF_001792900 [Pleodorina starrii]|nr:hypothetical protein PLESTF_001792900 [Pleodorina starrii]